MSRPARPTLEELFDRLEIDELLTRYATAIDTKTFDLLDTVFTPDAHIDYTTAGGIAGDFATVKAWLAEVLPHFAQYQHVVGNRNVAIDGDTATSVSTFFNPMVMQNGSTFFCGGEYRDQLVRTADGWRIGDRFEQTVWTYGSVPAAPA
jgi:3-phenylpropionate/cinnamic acid dioxygenase small subunit